MIIYCMSDIHGCLAEFEDALSLVLDDIEPVSYTHLDVYKRKHQAL